MSAVHKISWKNKLLEGTKSLGNTGQSLLEKASELLNDYCKNEKMITEVAERAGLCPSTIKRIMALEPTELGNDPDSKGDTLTRIFLTFGAGCTWHFESIKPQYLPKPKEKI